MKNSSSFFQNAKALVALWLNNFLGIDQKIREATKDSIRTDQFEGLAREVSNLKEKLTPAKVSNIMDPNLHKRKGFNARVEFSGKDRATIGFTRPLYSEHGKIDIQHEFPFFTYPSTDGYYGCDRKGLTSYYGASGERLSALKALYESRQIHRITLSAFSIDITKPSASEWSEVLSKIFESLEEYFTGLEEVPAPAEESSSQE
jgi:hypothetical protein